MILIINTTNIVVGGGIQVSLSFIEEMKKFNDNEYHIFLSKAVSLQVKKESFPKNFLFYQFDISPSSLTKGYKVRRSLSRLEKNINPDIVFTIFGPAYWTPRTLHVSGFADGWCYNPNSIAFKHLSFTKKIRNLLLVARKNFEIIKADYIVVETNTARDNIIKYLKFKSGNIFVVGNTYHSIYSKSIFNKNSSDYKSKNVFKLLVLSAFYPHKNIKIINKVVPILQSRSNKKFIFYLTINDLDFQHNFIKSDFIKNLGPQNVADCPKLYETSDALFLPSLLETFSANYPEAMIMNKPILTSNYDFAKEICQDAALYFDPLNPEEIAEKIILLSESEDIYNSLILKGEKQLLVIESPESRAQKYVKLFQEIIKIKV